MHKFRTNKISKNDFLTLNEKDLMFITNPGRMGDEDGSTFIIRDGEEFKIYRVNGWMYPSKNEKESISLDDTIKQFPEWYEAWEHGNDKNYEGKYKYIYMGFGNGLCVDNSIYNDYEPYLSKLVEEYLSDKEEKESLKYVVIFNVWENAFINMVNDKKLILKS